VDGGMRPPAVRVVPIGGRAAGQVLIGVVAVVVEPTAHGRELPECDLVTAWHPRHVAVDRIVKTKLPLVRQQQDGDHREALTGAADAHVDIRCHRLACRHIAHAEGAHVRCAGHPARYRPWLRESNLFA